MATNAQRKFTHVNENKISLIGGDRIRSLSLLTDLLKTPQRADVLQQLHYWLTRKNVGMTDKNGIKWVWGTFKEWGGDFFQHKPETLRKHFRFLRELGVVVVDQKNRHRWDMTNYYTINYWLLDELYKRHIERGVSSRKTNADDYLNTLKKWRDELLSQNDFFNQKLEASEREEPTSSMREEPTASSYIYKDYNSKITAYQPEISPKFSGDFAELEIKNFSTEEIEDNSSTNTNLPAQREEGGKIYESSSYYPSESSNLPGGRELDELDMMWNDGYKPTHAPRVKTSPVQQPEVVEIDRSGWKTHFDIRPAMYDYEYVRIGAAVESDSKYCSGDLWPGKGMAKEGEVTDEDKRWLEARRKYIENLREKADRTSYFGQCAFNGSILPPKWEMPLEWKIYALQEKWSIKNREAMWSRERVEKVSKRFVMYYTKKKLTKDNWFRTWQNWVQRELPERKKK